MGCGGDVKSEAEMSMAIENLGAILDLQDVGQVIALLQNNNWDESAAAQAFCAKQAADRIDRINCAPAR